ncbi:ZZ-type zinc finger-containing protein 3-like [Ornithodoros turicata]
MESCSNQIPNTTDDQGTQKSQNGAGDTSHAACHAVVKTEPPEPQEPDEDYDDIGEYFFESDHLALRGNTDYRNVLKTLAVLEAQRVQVILDIEKLMEIRDEALQDPVRFVERLQKKEDIGIPIPQTVPQLPSIDWGQYSLSNTPHAIESKRQTTRLAAKSEPKVLPSTSSAPIYQNNVMVRGRVFSEHKPATFNQLWSAEEQKRLEELLIKFPPEEVESRRWEKIAAELGNRTPTQVASRVQKYFIKLAKAGLPVPGRIPNVSLPRKTGGTTRRSHHRSNLMFSHSTFFASHRPPVYMTEADDESSSFVSNGFDSEFSTKSDVASEDEDTVDAAARETPEYRELMMLKRVREERLKKTGLVQHIGFKCDRCETDPIVGTRWHCTDCPPKPSVDFCNDCVDCMHETATHKEDHHIEPIRVPEDSLSFVDKDYMHFTGSDYNYLDTNYFPAT